MESSRKILSMRAVNSQEKLDCIAASFEVGLLLAQAMERAVRHLLKGEKEQEKTFTDRVIAHLRTTIDNAWVLSVQMDREDTGRYTEADRAWRKHIENDLPTVVVSAVAVVIARLQAVELTAKLLSFWSTQTLGVKWEAFQRMTEAEQNHERLRQPISGASAEVRAQVQAFCRAHAALYGDAGQDAAKQMLVAAALVEKLDPTIAAHVPGTMTLAKTVGTEAFLSAVAEAAEKAERLGRGAWTPVAATATTTTAQTGRDQQNVKKDGKKIKCFRCGAEGHMIKECKAKKGGGACHFCGKEGHLSRRCPEATCLKCGEKGHILAACGEQANKPEDGPYISVQTKKKRWTRQERRERKCVGGVLKVRGRYKGKKITVGLDTFAGLSLVKSDLVHGEVVRKTNVELEGVGGVVRPQGEVHIAVEVGHDVVLEDQAVVMQELPGGADVLVGKDVLQDKGLQLEASGVWVQGQRCEEITEGNNTQRQKQHQKQQQQGRQNTKVAAIQETVAAATARAVETIERVKRENQWRQIDSTEVFGRNLGNEHEIPLDDFCLPEWRAGSEEAEREYEAKVEALLEGSDLKTEAARKRYKEVMMRGKEAYCLSLDDFVPGQLDVEELQLHVSAGKPIVDQQRRHSPEDEEWMRAKTLEFDEIGLWEKPREEIKAQLWISNPVIVKRENPLTGEVTKRLTVDFWGPNSRIEAPPQRTPTVQELADRVREAMLFDKDDGFSGYYQRKLHPDSQKYTGVYTPLGVRVFKCMPMGISVAPAEWNGAMQDKFKDMPTNRFFALMDDFVRWTPAGSTREQDELEHVELLEKFLEAAIHAKLKLKLPKAKHAVEEIEALGMMYGRGHMWKRDWTTAAVKNYRVPTTYKQMERFLAFGRYYESYVEGYSRMTEPLRRLQAKKKWNAAEMDEGTKAREAFEKVKKALEEDVKLRLPDWTRPFIVKTDFSCEGIAAALLQEDDEGRLGPVAFASRKCSEQESGLEAPDGELVALVMGVKKFERFLWGTHFHAYVDQCSLSWLKDKRLSSIRNRNLQQLFAYMRQFRFTLNYRKAQDMEDVDALSRAVGERDQRDKAQEEQHVEGTVEVSVECEGAGTEVVAGVALVEMEGRWDFDTALKDMKEEQLVDEECKAIKEVMAGKKLGEVETTEEVKETIAQYMSQDPKLEQFVEGDGGILEHVDLGKDGEIRRQAYVPESMRGRLVVVKHGSAAGGHRSDEEVVEKLKRKFFWIGMNRDVKDWIGACSCQRKKGEVKPKSKFLQQHKIRRPREKIVFDILGPLPVSLKGNKYILSLVDVGSREVMLEALDDRKAERVAKVIMERVYLRGWSPKVFQSDLAKEFVGEVMTELVKTLGAKFRHSSPYHPQTNTHVERYNRTIATHLSLVLEREDQRDWDDHLKVVEYAQLVGASRVLGRLSPLFLQGGWEAMDPVDRVWGRKEAKSMEVEKWLTELEKGRQIAQQTQSSLLGRQMKKEWRVNEEMEEGHEVWVMFPQVGRGKAQKLAFRMHGPYVIEKWLHKSKKAAMLHHRDEVTDKIVAHVDRMFPKRAVPQRLQDRWKPIWIKEEEKRQYQEGLDKQHQMKGGKQQMKKQFKGGKQQAKVNRKAEEEEYEIEKIVARVEHDDGSVEYKVRWKGYGPSDDLWISDDEMLRSAPTLMADYEEANLNG